MKDNTVKDYNRIKRDFLAAPYGTIREEIGEDKDGTRYAYMMLEQNCAHEQVQAVIDTFALLAIQTQAYLTMNIHDDYAAIRLAVSGPVEALEEGVL